jgi:hypothetical protein
MRTPPVLGLAGSALAVALSLTHPREARACGCFARPSAAVARPVLQAGEQIAFAVENGEVVAHIKIQYQGDASDFGWLLPLPSLPKLELGTDELFRLLDQNTAPTYTVTYTYPSGSCGGGSIGCGGCGSP